MLSYPNFENCTTKNDYISLINKFIEENKDSYEFFYPGLLKAGAFIWDKDGENHYFFICNEKDRLYNIEWENSGYILNKTDENYTETEEEFKEREIFEEEFFDLIKQKVDKLIDYQLNKLKNKNID
jgi:hypothetical protein